MSDPRRRRMDETAARHSGCTVQAWGEFLKVRARVICWMMEEEKRTPTEIARTLSMDPDQVLLIRMGHGE